MTAPRTVFEKVWDAHLVRPATADSPAPNAEVTIDLEARTVRLSDGTTASFPLEPFARYCLLEGIDELSFLLSQDTSITSHEARAFG